MVYDESDTIAGELTSAQAPADRLLGTVLDGTFRIEKLIARGGMGRVYVAENIQLHKKVAVKLIDSQAYAGQRNLARLRQEARLATRVKHSNIVQVFSFGATDSGAYIAEEYVDGGNLSELLTTEGALEKTRALALFRQICEGVAAIHNENIVHRDLKPANILLCGEGRDTVKISDFGIAKSIQSAEDLKLTATGEFIGTLAYTSPEHLMGRKLDQRSDIFSLGCILYEMLTGRRLLDYENPMDIIRMEATDRVFDDANLANELKPVIAKAVRNDPKDRYGTIAEWEKELDQLSDGAATKRQFYVNSKTRAWMRYGAMTLCALLVVGGVCSLFARERLAGELHRMRFQLDILTHAPYQRTSRDFELWYGWLIAHGNPMPASTSQFLDYIRRSYGRGSDEYANALLLASDVPDDLSKRGSMAEEMYEVAQGVESRQDRELCKKLCLGGLKYCFLDEQRWHNDPIKLGVLLSRTYYHLGDYEQARHWALNVYAHNNHQAWKEIAEVHILLGDLSADDGNEQNAMRHFHEANAIFDNSHSAEGSLKVVRHAVRAQIKFGRYKEAQALLGDLFAMDSWQKCMSEVNDQPDCAATMLANGELLEALNETDSALVEYKNAATHLEQRYTEALDLATKCHKKPATTGLSEYMAACSYGEALANCSVKLAKLGQQSRARDLAQKAVALHSLVLPATNAMLKQEIELTKV